MNENVNEHLWERIVVTGGAGFVGSNLALTLQERRPDARITVLDDFRSGSFANLREFGGDVMAFDLSDFDVEAVLGENAPTIVFHLASISDTRVEDDRKMIHDNVESFRRLLRFCATREVPLVYASSAATYGIADGRMAENAPARPANVYGFSKMILDNLAGETMIASPDLHIVGLRYFNVYGPGEAHKGAMASMVYQLARRMLAGQRPRVFKDGEQKRDFVYVKDVVEATILAATAQESGVYNVGSGEGRSFNELIAILNEALGTNLEPEYFDCPYPFFQPFTEADLAAARDALTYEPQYPLEKGVAEYVARLKAQAPDS